MPRRPSDFLDDLPDLQAFTVARACSPTHAMDVLLAQARHDANHIVRTGLRDVIDWLAEAGVRI